MRIPTAVAVATATALMAAGAALPAGAVTSSRPVVTPIGLWTIDEVSHTGRWVAGQGTNPDGVQILDRASGAVTPEPASGPRWFVRDNPVLRLNRDYVAEYPKAAVYLKNVATGIRRSASTPTRAGCR